MLARKNSTFPIRTKIDCTIAPYIEDSSQSKEEVDKLLDKKVNSVKKSKLLKDLIKSRKCNVVSERLLREDPVEAFAEATAYGLIPASDANTTDNSRTLKRTNSNMELFSDHYHEMVRHKIHFRKICGPQRQEIENIIENTTVTDRRYVGMLVGMGIVSAAGILASGGLFAIALCVVVGLGLGNYLGKKIRKSYKDIEGYMTRFERICFRACALMVNFEECKKRMERRTLTKVVEGVVYEGKQALGLKDKKLNTFIKKMKEFIGKAEVEQIIDEHLEEFNRVCENPSRREIPRIIEQLVNFYIPLSKIIRPDKGQHCSLYKRILVTIYGKDMWLALKKARRLLGEELHFLGTTSEKPEEPKEELKEVLIIENVNPESKAPPVEVKEENVTPVAVPVLEKPPQEPVKELPKPKPAPKITAVPKPVPKKRHVPPDIETLMGIYNEPTTGDEWSNVANEKDIVIYKKSVENSPMVLLKGVAILEGIPLEIMYKAIADAETRLKWETILGSFEVVESEPQTDSEIIYFSVKAPFPVQDRDFLQRRTTLFDYPAKGQILMHFKSIETPKKPVTKKCVRAHTVIAGYLFKELSKFPLRCSMSLVSQVDVKGYIPKTIVNMCAGRSSRNWVKSYKEGCKKLLSETRQKKN